MGARVGVVRLRGDAVEGDGEMLDAALAVLEQCGAQLVELPPVSLLSLKADRDDFFVLANHDFRRGVDAYLEATKAPVRSLAQVIAALGIRGIGNSVAHLLAERYRSLHDLAKANTEELEGIAGMGPRTAGELGHPGHRDGSPGAGDRRLASAV